MPLPGISGKAITYETAAWEIGWSEEQYEKMLPHSRQCIEQLDADKAGSTTEFIRKVCGFLSDPIYDNVYVPGLSLDDHDPLYWRAYDTLTHAGAVKPDDVKVLLNHSDEDVRGLGVLVACGRGDVQSGLRLMLADTSPLVRALAAQGASEQGASPLPAEMSKAAKDPSPLVRRTLAGGLSRADPLDAGATKILSVLLKDPEIQVRAEAVFSAAALLQDMPLRQEVRRKQLFGDAGDYRGIVDRSAADLLRRLSAPQHLPAPK